jgi:hypothetical protein
VQGVQETLRYRDLPQGARLGASCPSLTAHAAISRAGLVLHLAPPRPRRRDGRIIQRVIMTAKWLATALGGRQVGASEEDLDRVEARLTVKLPADYRAAMRHKDGGDAEFGQSWVVLWRVGDLLERNEGYRVAEFAPGFTFFGSDGAGEAYAWDWRPTRRALYVVIPFISPDPEAAVPCGDTFEEFLSVLHSGISFHSSDR